MNDQKRLQRAMLQVTEELDRAREKNAPMHSAHEGWAVIREELDELWDEVKKRKIEPELLRTEAIQVTAMGLRFIMDVCDKLEEGNGGKHR